MAKKAEIFKRNKELSVLDIFKNLRGLDNKRNEKDKIVQKMCLVPSPGRCL